MFNKILFQSIIKQKYIRYNHFMSFKGSSEELYINKNNISTIHKSVTKLEDNYIFVGYEKNILKLPIFIENLKIHMNNGEIINISHNIIETENIKKKD